MSVFNVAERAFPELTDDMTVADLVDVLGHLRFPTGKFRHIPVVDQSRLVGMISIGDVVKHHRQIARQRCYRAASPPAQYQNLTAPAVAREAEEEADG